jgi:hypothetical protein
VRQVVLTDTQTFVQVVKPLGCGQRLAAWLLCFCETGLPGKLVALPLDLFPGRVLSPDPVGQQEYEDNASLDASLDG